MEDTTNNNKDLNTFNNPLTQSNRNLFEVSVPNNVIR